MKKKYQLIVILIMLIATIFLFLDLQGIIKNKYINVIGYLTILLGTAFLFYKSRKKKL